MKFTARKSYTFYPDVNGNLDLPENERLSVEIIRPSAEERGDISYMEMSVADKSSPIVRMKFNAPVILRRCVGAISNLEIEDFENPENTRVIKTGEELAKERFYGASALVDAICTEVCTDVISDKQKKISK